MANSILSIASWANRNRIWARVFLASLLLLLCLLYLLLGFTFGADYWAFTQGWGAPIWMLAVGYLIWNYPARPGRVNFWRRFRFNAGIYGLAFMAFAWLGAHPSMQGERGIHALSQAPSFASLEQSEGYSDREAIQMSRKQQRKAKRRWKREMRKKLRKALRNLRHQGDGVKSWRKGYQALFFLGLGFLTFFASLIVIALSCSLLCSGASAAGAAFLALGIVGVGASVLFLLLSLKALVKPKDYRHHPGESIKYRREING